jgi:hypothetical protein
MDELIVQMVHDRMVLDPDQMDRVIDHVAGASFATDLLEADETLWGSFWHFDVISPGYEIPAAELALLRGVRLDGHWPQTTDLAKFLSDLRQTITSPRAGVWSLPLAKAPCLIIAAPEPPPEKPVTMLEGHPAKHHPWPGGPVGLARLMTIVWYCALTGQLHAGYRTVTTSFPYEGVLEHRPAKLFQVKPGKEPTKSEAAAWLLSAVEQREIQDHAKQRDSLAVQLDLEILRLRILSASETFA